MPGDLHNHTTFSDGSCPAEMLPHLAAAAGLDWIAITDHDSMASVRFAYSHPEMDGARLMPGVELSGYDLARGSRVHILCYWPADCEALQAHCRTMAERRHEAVSRSMALLKERCPQFREQDALRYAKDSEGALFKANVMRAMMDYGLADSIYGDTYKSLFRKGPEEGGIAFGPAYEDCRSLFRLARECGGVAVLAHPSVYHNVELAAELAQEGLLDGIEIDHPRNTPADRATLEAIAREYDLIVTGGTDFHGINRKISLPVGSGVTSTEMVERINALAADRK